MTDANLHRHFDVVLFGATGFTGKLVASYLNAHRSVVGHRWAIAGRSRDRLARVRDSLGLHADVGLLQADTADPSTLATMAMQAKCVINVVGPFSESNGALVVEACVENGAHYVDLSGETGYNADLIESFHKRAHAAKVVIAPSCGLDSLPSDLTTFLACRHLRRKGVESVRSAVTCLHEAAPFSSGTLLSACHMADNDARQLMFCDSGRLATKPPHAELTFAWPTWQAQSQGYGTSYMLSPHNVRTVYRTWSLLQDTHADEAYGAQFQYQDMLLGGSGAIGYVAALASGTVQRLTGALLCNLPPLRRLVRATAKSGDGPSTKAQTTTKTDCRTVAYAADDKKTAAVCTMTAPGDPGYSMTARMIAEAALALAQDHTKLHPLAKKGGVLTPALIGADILVKRLEAFAEFEVVVSDFTG